MSDPPTGPTLEPGPALFRAIENVLVAGHTLRHALKKGHIPPDAPLGDAVMRYGAGTLQLDIWVGCAAIEMLRRAWTGKGTPVVHAMPVAVVMAPPPTQEPSGG